MHKPTKIKKGVPKFTRYKHREYCKAVGCTKQAMLELGEVDKYVCVPCMAHHFHQWLKKNHYLIIKNPKYTNKQQRGKHA